MLCDHCLIIGYADQIRRIDHKIVEEAIEYFREGERRPRKRRRRLSTWRRALVGWRLSAAALLILGSAAALTIAHRTEFRQVLDRSTATLSELAHVASRVLGQ